MPISKKTAKAWLPNNRPIFYYITDRAALPNRDLMSAIRRALQWGVDCIQIREKDLDDRALFDLVKRVTAICRHTKCLLLVNSRPDIALAAGADGVHLPAGDLRVRDLRPWLPPGFLIGVSTHSFAEIRTAREDSADYVLFGPVFETPSKLGLGRPLGLGAVAAAARKYRMPIVALGGIKPQTIATVIATGVAGVAGISLFQKYLPDLVTKNEFSDRLLDPFKYAESFSPV